MKKIQLGHHRNKKYKHPLMYALVDDEDYEELSKFKWYIDSGGHTHYGTRSLPKTEKDHSAILMHREILGLKKGEVCDHIDGNGLNNQRNNLRKATISQNCANRISYGSSKHLGVSWHKISKRWRAQIQKNGIVFHLGSFESEEEAALAYNVVAKEKHKDFAKLNIIKNITPNK